jgi:hypothetical protein
MWGTTPHVRQLRATKPTTAVSSTAVGFGSFRAKFGSEQAESYTLLWGG